MRIRVPDMQAGYVEVCRRVMEEGQETSPRGLLTKEVLDAVIIVENPARCLPLGCGRTPNVAIAAAEALQLIGGVSYPELMVKITKNFAQFRDGGIFHGAYGPRVRNQIGYAVQRLIEDKDTRQAVVTIWDPAHDLYGEAQDLPCTVMLQFLIRQDHLIMHTTMRSNDVWWGLAYDAFQFTQLQIAVANAIGRPVGAYHHHAVSLHCYERDWDKIEDLRYDPSNAGMLDDVFARVGMGIPGPGWSMVSQRARNILAGLRRYGERGPAIDWYFETLERYL